MTAMRAVPPHPLAPWAEVVPDAPFPMTIGDFLDYPGEEGYCYELVEGVLVRMVGTRPRAGRVTRNLLYPLAAYVQAHDLGTVTPPDEVYDFEGTGQKDTGLLPDIGFYNVSRDPLVDPDEPYPFAPDLAVEVASSTQYRPAMKAKAERYLAGGTALVWIVWPRRQQVDVWHPNEDEPITLRVGDTLSGESVIAGFSFPLANLFA